LRAERAGGEDQVDPGQRGRERRRHTDPIGSFRVQLGLSKRRADAVTAHLRSRRERRCVEGMSFTELVKECRAARRGDHRVQRAEPPRRDHGRGRESGSADAPAKVPAKKK